MDNKDFLLEIGCEELPPSQQQSLAEMIGFAIVDEINLAGLTHLPCEHYATPRRIAVLIPGLASQQSARTIEKLGPNVTSAYDKNGTPTLACLGFARSCGVSTDKLSVKKTPKGDRVAVILEEPGQLTQTLIPEIIHQALKKLGTLKLMRWGNQDTRFVRPVHWVVLLYGNEVVPCDILGKNTSHETRGHRFHYPYPLRINQPKDYNKILYSQGSVVANFKQRKNLIRKLINNTLGDNHRVVMNEDLLDEVTALVEWPVVLKGQFSKDFLKIPREVLITSMQTHQKCFAIEDVHGQLQPFFIIVSNIESKDPNAVIKGNERVIAARLSDAAFFYKNDLKHPLEDYLPRLKEVVFQHEIGSMEDKSIRIAHLARTIANQIGGQPEIAYRAGLLCKCDLLSGMVGEFPGLQGIMGYYYALAHHDNEACAIAIKEHYLPSFSKDSLPTTEIGCACALADRLDTLIGILGINRIPTGDKDPFKLRRAALGILRILIERSLSLDLMQLLTEAQQAYSVAHLPNKAVVEMAFDFIINRLKYWYLDQGIAPEVFESVNANQPTVPLDFHHRLLAVCEFQKLPEAQALAAANKRVSNILKKNAEIHLPNTLDENLFELNSERELAKQLEAQAKAIHQYYQSGDYTQVLKQLSTLKQPIDKFFDEVMIMVDDEKVRNNRLALLMRLRTLFTQVADISLLP